MNKLAADVSVSVAMCTYRGGRYLDEQLGSIAGQTRPPDEVVVCDDGSTDGTLAILDRFRSQARFPVRIYRNDGQLGATKNFERAISYCQGGIILLSDQDDVWHPEKVSALLSVFLTSPDIGAVFSDAEVVDERLATRGYSVWGFVGFGAADQRRFARAGALDVLLKHNVVVGMTMGFRAQFRDLVVPIPADWVHDRWIPLLIAAVADVATVPKRLVKYRQHGAQGIGMVRRGLAESLGEKRKVGAPELRRLADQYEAAYDRLTARKAEYQCSAKALRRVQAKINHIRARSEIRDGKGRLRLLMREIFTLNYRRYSSGWKSVAVDMFLS